MAHTRPFARSRTLKVLATLCVLCALAFALGQETAAFRAAQMQAAVANAPTIHAAPPLPAIPTAVAHGETQGAATASQTAAPPQELAVSVNQPSPGNGHAHKHDKKKHGSQHDAAGDSSHGGISHHGGHAGGHTGGAHSRGSSQHGQ